MKNIIQGFTLCFLFLASQTVFAVNSHSKVMPKAFLTVIGLDQNQLITTEKYLTLTPKEIYKTTGNKLTLKEKIGLKITQNVIRKKLKKGEEFSFEDAANYNFSIGGFLLGFFLGLLGVLIALIAFPKDVFKSSLVGFLCFVIALLLGLLVF